MARCHNCNAPYTVEWRVCEYCGALRPPREQNAQCADHVNPYREAEAARQSREREEERKRKQVEQEVRSNLDLSIQTSTLLVATNRGVIAALVGLVGIACFFPVGALVGLFYYYRVRFLAADARKPVPLRNRLTLFMSLVGIAVGALEWLVVIPEFRQDAAREEELEARLEGTRTQPTLTREVACDLLELNLLKNNMFDYTIKDSFFCHNGVVMQEGSKAMLHEVRIVKTGTRAYADPYTCFEWAGSSWQVTHVRDDAGCGIPPASAEPTAP